MAADQPNESTRAAGLSRLRELLRNPISLVGFALAVVSLVNILFLFLIDLMSEHPNAYVGILAYMVAPRCLILALLLVPIGVWIDRSRRPSQKPGETPRYLRIDFSGPGQPGAVAFFLSFLVVFVMMSAMGSYRAYECTDSVQFCGQLCHSVMNPEFTAYQLSPHARVACVDCHVGAGATWYVRSKLSGARQVFATPFNTFPRPIPTPVKNLRPSQETCEQCHWPRKFVGDLERTYSYFLQDETNTPFTVRLLMKVGGGDPTHGPVGGIHWHMNVGNKIEYLATDQARQKIPYVRMTDLQGVVTEFRSPRFTNSVNEAELRRMDCMDCHNRPAHRYEPPNSAVNPAIP